MSLSPQTICEGGPVEVVWLVSPFEQDRSDFPSIRSDWRVASASLRKLDARLEQTVTIPRPQCFIVSSRLVDVETIPIPGSVASIAAASGPDDATDE
jgi:hypothetical protein